MAATLRQLTPFGDTADDPNAEDELNGCWRGVPVVLVLRGGFRISGVVDAIHVGRSEIALKDGAREGRALFLRCLTLSRSSSHAG